jgi:hypothetical protein
VVLFHNKDFRVANDALKVFYNSVKIFKLSGGKYLPFQKSKGSVQIRS